MRSQVRRFLGGVVDRLGHRVREWTRPRPRIFLGTASDLTRCKKDPAVENALLRQQLIVVRRQLERVRLRPTDRVRMVLLARLARSWQDALMIVKPETVLRWHRRRFRLFWQRKLASKRRSQRIPEEVGSCHLMVGDRQKEA